MQIQNAEMKNYQFLRAMYADSYFPKNLVKKGEDILRELCQQIEEKKPASLDELYKLTHEATDRFNDLQDEFYEQDCEIETEAREAIGGDFKHIANSYGFSNADIEELIATRDW